MLEVHLKYIYVFFLDMVYHFLYGWRDRDRERDRKEKREGGGKKDKLYPFPLPKTPQKD